MTRKAAPKPVERNDAWYNTLSKLGEISTDKARANRFQIPESLTSQEYGSLYDFDWLARRIVEGLPSFALSKGITSDDEVTLKAFRAIDRTPQNPQGALFRGLAMGRLHGGALILLGAKSSAALDQPLPEGARIEWLDVVNRADFAGEAIDNDAGSATFGQATRYRIIGNHRRRGNTFHASRAILCEGLLPSDEQLTRSQPIEAVRGQGIPVWLSVLAPVFETLGLYGISWASLGSLLQEASIGVFSMAGVIEMLASENQTAIDNRLALLSLSRSVAKTILLDAKHGETFERKSVSFADTPQIMAQIHQLVAGAADMPVTVLFKTSPGGLNATGDSDMRQWYDSIELYRDSAVRPKLERILRCIAGKDVAFDFPPIWQPTAAESANVRAQNAQADRTYYDMGAIDADEVRNARIADGTLGLALEERTPEESARREAEAAARAAEFEAYAKEGAKIPAPEESDEDEPNGDGTAD